MRRSYHREVFRGNPTLMLPGMCVGGLAILLVFSVVMMGRYWCGMFLYMSMAIPLSMGTVWLALRFFDWFYFDDETQRIVYSFRQSTPYEKITAINIADAHGFFSVSAKTGPRRSDYRPLIQVLGSQRKTRLERQLRKRFADKVVYKKLGKRSDWRWMLLAMTVPLVVIYVVFFFWMDLYPWTRIVPGPTPWGILEGPHGVECQLGAVSFSIPEHYEQTAKGDRYIEFRNVDTKGKLKAVLSTDISIPPFGSRVLGMRDAYDFYRKTYTGRFGIALLMSKLIILCHLYDVRLYEIEHGDFKGFLVRGGRRGLNIAEMQLFDQEEGQLIEFTLSSIESIEDDVLAGIVHSVRRDD